MNSKSQKTNPINKEKSFDNMVSFFKRFNKLFDNDAVDSIVNQEFRKEYALLPLLVKAQIYYNEN